MFKPPKKIPQKGFYYHYKHDPKGPINNYAYEFLGVGMNTEDGTSLAIYLPIYEARVYKAGKLYDIRPLNMWMEKINKNNKTVPRFKKIKEDKIIAKLKKIKKNMYSQ